MKLMIFGFILLVASLTAACSNPFSPSTNNARSSSKITNDTKAAGATDPVGGYTSATAGNKKQVFPISEDDFSLMVEFIEKKGFAVKERGVKSDHQFTFVDPIKNRHALITIKRDENGRPSTAGTVEQISVWAYRNGIKDQEHFFGYAITKYGAYLFSDDPNPVEFVDMKFAVEQFLSKVKSSK